MSVLVSCNIFKGRRMEAWTYLLQMMTQKPSVKANQIIKDTMYILSMCVMHVSQ